MKAELAFKSLVAVVCIGMMLPVSAGLAQGTPSASPGTAKVCPVTLPGPEVYNVGNYGNDALAVHLDPSGVTEATPNGNSANGPYGSKFGWFRVTPGVLTITGNRIDAAAPPLTADIPASFGTHAFVPTGITFPTLGCWEVTCHVAGKSLTFVTIVIDVSGPTAPSAPATPAARPTS